MITLSIDGFVSKLLFETMASEQSFWDPKDERMQEKFILMLLENAVAMGFATRTCDGNDNEEKFLSTPALLENWDRLFDCPFDADRESVLQIEVHGNRSKMFSKQWPSNEALEAAKQCWADIRKEGN